jgi:DNA (cytosine-5)-methyltransferase 1
MRLHASTVTVTDLFCGAGGSTTGAVQAGADVRLAVNHWRRAVETHNTNYPLVDHILTDISQADPRYFPHTTLLIASPECTNHSLAKGKKRKETQGEQATLWEPAKPPKPEEERSRCTMWDPLRFAEVHDYQAVILENVVDARKWRMWEPWLAAWKALDYEWAIVYFNSQFAPPTPQSRDRMYCVFWKRKNRRPHLTFMPPAFCARCEQFCQAVQSWKKPEKPYGRYGKRNGQYVYRCPRCAQVVQPSFMPAASAIDWSIPTPRIGERNRPLKPKTVQRIKLGLQKFRANLEPFTVQVNKTTDRFRPLSSDVLPTQTADNGLALVNPFLMSLSHGSSKQGYVYPARNHPYPTQTARDDVALVTPFIVELHRTSIARSLTDPLATVCAGGNHHGLVVPNGAVWTMSYYRNGSLIPIDEGALGTVTTLERHALVTAATADEEVEACGFRMLEPHEIQAAMAFPRDYIVIGTRRERVKQLGNAVTPPVMQMLMERVLASLS